MAQKVVRIPLISEHFYEDGTQMEYAKVCKILWNLQSQTREIKNKTIQYCWEYFNFSNDYYKKFNEYPNEKDVLSFTLSGFVNDKFKDGYYLSSKNNSTTSRLVCSTFKKSHTDILKGIRSVPSYKKDQPLDIDSQTIKLTYEKGIFYFKITLLNQAGRKEYGLKNCSLMFKANIRSGSEKAILERCVDNIYQIGGSKLIYNKKKRMWELNLTYKFENKKIDTLDKNKICGVDLGIVHPLYASIYGEYKRIVFDKDEIETFRKRIEARRKALLRQTKYCGDGRIGHGRETRCKPAYKIEDKIAMFRDTANHKYSKSLVDFAVKNNCGVIQMEDLTGVTQNPNNKDTNKYFKSMFLKNWSYYDLQNKIKNKAESVGIKVVLIDPQYTSQRCSKCGYIDKENRPEQAVFKCKKCDFSENADYNASQNIATKDIDKIISSEIKKSNP